MTGSSTTIKRQRTLHREIQQQQAQQHNNNAADVPTDDKNVIIKYTLRGLYNDDEVKEWSKFCSDVFAYKSNPPSSSYFERHYYNDPNRTCPSLIRVATTSIVEPGREEEEEKETIVASCRIFCRSISSYNAETSSNCIMNAGGIGEVCTHIDHRKRGLSKELLLDAISIMKDELQMDVTFLHSAPPYYPVYQSIGYQCTTTCWSIIPITVVFKKQEEDVVRKKNAVNEETATPIRSARFPQDTTQLMMIHRKFSEQRYLGCIIRTEEYWNQYISVELPCTDNSSVDSLWVYEENDKIIGWLSIRQRGDENRYQLREFGCDDISKNGYRVLSSLLMKALQKERRGDINAASTNEEGIAENNATTTTRNIHLQIPTSILDDIFIDNNTDHCCSSSVSTEEVAEGEGNFMMRRKDEHSIKLDRSRIQINDDHGWMYMPLKDGVFTTTMHDLITNGERSHLIWPADSF